MKRAAATVALTVAAVAFALALLEVAVRLWFPAFDPSGGIDFTYGVNEGLSLGQPNTVVRQHKNSGDYDITVRINARGLRDDRDIGQATADDIVVLGDSVAWGWGVETHDRFSNLLERLTGRRFFNVSAPTDIGGYRRLLDYAHGAGGAFDRVVLALSMETDLRDYDAPLSADDEGEGLTWREWLAERSAAYVMIATAVHRTPWLKQVAIRTGLIVPSLQGIARHTYSAAMVDSSARQVATLSQRHRLLVVLIPSRALWTGDNREVEDRIHRAFAAALARHGIEVVDLRPDLEAGGAPLSYHFANDGHWNQRGHRLAADVIAKRLGGF